jgi:transcriptional regulator with XRE-family HTH domain
MPAKPGIQGAVTLRRWRRDAHLSRPAAAAALGISERMLAYYETGEYAVPRTVLLAVLALAANLAERPTMTRERWVTLVGNLRQYGSGVPVVGRMMQARDLQGLRDFLDFVMIGPDPDLALTDPALFQTLRAAVTRAQLAGLARYCLCDHVARRREIPNADAMPPTQPVI